MHRLQGLPFFMPSQTIYLDESGDLGWSFDKPYRSGGSSRYLTIAFLVVPSGEAHTPKRIVRKVYKHFRFDPATEVKGSHLDSDQLDYVAYRIRDFIGGNAGYCLGAITVRKERVQEHIRADENKIYNYMIKLSVVPSIVASNEVHLIRDNRSIKVKSGSSLKDYLQMALWFETPSTCKLHDFPEESNQNENLVFIDWVAHIVWSKYEDQSARYCNIFAKQMAKDLTLYF
jgi:hypothetical protein